jgi:ABC-type molybdenum transport system ATPase subunit/photorepair protein PhrA
MTTPTAYAEVSVVVDGGLDEERTFYDETLMRDFLATVEGEAKDHGYPTEVFVLHHEHEPMDECACVQYLQDHKPFAEYNVR